MQGIIDQFTELRSPFQSVHTASRNLEIVSHAKILACDSNNHIAEIIKKARKRQTNAFFVIQLKRAKLPSEDIMTCSRVRVQSFSLRVT